MPLSDSIRDLAAQILERLDESRDFYLHTQQAWRFVQTTAHEGQSVGVLDTATGREILATDLEDRAQRYVKSHLAVATFKGLSNLLEEWVLGLARRWLIAHPGQLDAAHKDAADKSLGQRREQIRVPLSEILNAPDRASILERVAERVVRDLAYRRPEEWFRFLDNRVALGCPDPDQRAALGELKAARDALEHNRGVIGPEYRKKAGAAARYDLGEVVEVEGPDLLDRFDLLRDVIEAMTAAAIGKATGSVAF